MGFLSTATTIQLTAKLTPEGRRRLITNTNSLIDSFSLGDSDINYGAYTGLTTGQVPGVGGDDNGLDVNNGGSGYALRSTLVYGTNTDKKSVDAASITVNTVFEPIGYKTIHYSGNVITQNKISLSNTSTDSLTNLFSSFGLPISTSDFNVFTGTTANNGGYSNTSFSGLAQNDILVVGVDNSAYSELIDGKSIKMSLSSTATTFDIYGTYQATNRASNLLDNDISDVTGSVNVFGPNRTLLFSDGILKPNGGDTTKSWSTGYATNKPFSVNGKELFNYTSTPSLSLTGDTPIGIAYLDSGFMVITEPTIVDNFILSSSAATGTSITFNHSRTKVTQSITCVAGRGEFPVSTNPTWAQGDTPGFTEVALFDTSNTIIAIGKLDRTYFKAVDDMIAFNVTINY